VAQAGRQSDRGFSLEGEEEGTNLEEMREWSKPLADGTDG
jgi:hypothetical protein